jgi:enterochelin esterase family protein
MKTVMSLALVASVLCFAARPCAAQEADKLAGVLVNGEDWQVAAEGLNFTDATSADADGNLYFSDLRAKPAVIFKLSPDGKQTKVAEAAMSGTKMGPDGKLYGCGGGKVMSFDLSDGKATLIADGLQPNDLVVSHKGDIYITETGKKQVTLIDPKTGKKTPVDVGITKPNGIALSPDQKLLYVSDYGGLNVWSFTIEPDGTLTDKKPAMTMKAPEKKPQVAGGDGMTVDTQGRAYVCTALGLQIFDAKGELIGVLPKPQEGPLTNVALAGPDLQYLYVSCGTKVFKRKTQAKAVLFYKEPLK